MDLVNIDWKAFIMKIIQVVLSMLVEHLMPQTSFGSAG